MKCKDVERILLLLIILIINIMCIGHIYRIYNNIEIVDVSVKDVVDDKVSISIKAKLRSENWKCNLKSKDGIITSKNKKDTCNIDIKTNTDYTLFIENSSGKKTDEVSLNDYLGYILDFSFDKNKIYLYKDQKYDLLFNNVLLTSKTIDYAFKSSDENIATIKDNKIVGIDAGTVKIVSDKTKQELEVIVTDLIHAPVAEGKKKKVIPCGVYNQEQSDLLEEVLKFQVNDAGYGTRAGAVAAARFLTLEFEYRVPYFYENGRINETGVHYADGEGRYYHDGLYLTEEKFKDLKYTYGGKATWGCPLINYQSLPSYGYVPGKKMPNGLDCSGFVTWALKNGGFDPGDVGAGETPREGQCTDLGVFTPINKTLFTSGKVRTGDLINFFGHIGMIIGIDLEHDEITIAESLPNLGGAIARTYTLNHLVKLFTHVVLMDDYYKEDGNYTIMWEKQ